MELDIRFHGAQEICATWGPIVVRICDGVRTEVDDLARVETLFDELLQSWPTVGQLLVFTHDTPYPTAATQRYAIQALRRFDDKVVVAVALLGLGFWSSAFRTGLSAFVRLVRGGLVAIEGSAEGAIARLTTELIGVDPDALQRAYMQLWGELERGRLRAS